MGNRVAGIDFGTDSLRVSVHEVSTGESIYTVRRDYSRWAEGRFCDPQNRLFRQHPLDHLEALEACFTEVAESVGTDAISAISVVTTGSTIAPVDQYGVPLALTTEFSADPDAMFWMWKDQTSSEEAAVLNDVLRSGSVDYTTYQGEYSSEWWWAKILRAIRLRPEFEESAASWMEHSDWICHLLLGADRVGSAPRNMCAAAHKGLYNSSHGGQVPSSVLGLAHPYLGRVASTLAQPREAGSLGGLLCGEWASRLRLPEFVRVGIGSLDAHAGAVAAGIRPGTAVKAIGTSSVDLFLAPNNTTTEPLRGLCGLGEDSIIPGYLGGESGQAAFGDLFAWFSQILMWPLENVLREELLSIADGNEVDHVFHRTQMRLLGALENRIDDQRSSMVQALDWVNGRRYPDPDSQARGALLNLSIGDNAVDVYQSLLQAAVLGSKAIYDGLSKAGLSFDRLIAVGGIAHKSPVVCQYLADALNVEVALGPDVEYSAKGAALFAAVSAGHYENISDAQECWSEPFVATYTPSPAGTLYFESLYKRYEHMAAQV